MQRLLAALLLCVTGFMPVGAWVNASYALKLPACCRVQGKHQCVMQRAAEGGASFRSIADKCPFAASIGAPAVTASISPVPVITLFSHNLASQWIGRAEAKGFFHVAFDRSDPKRGPPSILS